MIMITFMMMMVEQFVGFQVFEPNFFVPHPAWLCCYVQVCNICHQHHQHHHQSHHQNHHSHNFNYNIPFNYHPIKFDLNILCSEMLMIYPFLNTSYCIMTKWTRYLLPMDLFHILCFVFLHFKFCNFLAYSICLRHIVLYLYLYLYFSGTFICIHLYFSGTWAFV